MRTIRDLLVKEETVWVYLNNEDACKAFYKQAYEEGFNFGDLPYEEWRTGSVIAVNADGSMAHLPLFIWTSAFDKNGWRGIKRSHTPIDYARYSAGEEDYFCKTSHFQPVHPVIDGSFEIM